MTVYLFNPATNQVKALAQGIGITVDDSGSTVIVTATGGASGAAVLFTQTATATIANSAAEASLIGAGSGGLTIAANGLIVGRQIRLDAWAVLSTKIASPGTLEIKVKLGSTIILDGAIALVSGATNILLRLEAVLICRSIGASGTIMAQGKFTVTTAGEVPIILSNALSAVTVDTTVTELLGVTATFSLADANNSISVTNLSLETLN